MDNIDQLIKEIVEPYILQIQELQQKQREKEAEIVTLKYAIVELDRKYQELEKKIPTPANKRVGATTAGRSSSRTATVRNTLGSSTTQPTPRTNSKTPGLTSPTKLGRERSKTPTANNKLQNSLNQSGKFSTLAGNTERSNSRNRTSELQSHSGLKRTVQGKEEQKKQSSLSNSPSKTDRTTSSRLSSRQGLSKDRGETTSSLTVRKSAQGTIKNQSPSKNSSFQAALHLTQNHITDNGILILRSLINSLGAVQATFGNIQTYVYEWEKKPKREDPKIKPQANIKLCYVPSYNGKTSRHNIKFINHQHIAFFSSTVAIVMNIETYEQRLLQGHTNHIQCIDYNKQHKYLCTGQVTNQTEKVSCFILWDIATYSKIVTVAYHQKQVSQVAFDESGSYLVTIGWSDKVSLAVWRVKDLVKQDEAIKEPLCECIIGKSLIHSLYIDNQHSNNNTLNLVLGADQGIKFFTIKIQDRIIEEKKATLSSSEGIKNIYSVAFNQDDILVAGDNGIIYSFRQDKVADSKFKAETSQISCIGFIEKRGRSYLATFAEEGGKVKLWDGSDLVELIDLIDDDIKAKLGTESPILKPKAFAFQDGILLVGFEQNCILRLDIEKKKRDILISSPSQSPQQIVAYPKGKAFALVGYDKYLRIYSYQSIKNRNKNCLINTVELQNQAKSCDFSPNGKYLAVGYDNGVFEVFQVYDNDGEFFQLECLKLFDLNRKQPINCVRFSPDGRFLVISCHKDMVVFNAQNDEFEQEGLLKAWELKTGSFQRVDPQQVKDVEWDRKSCIYQWDTLGIWDPEFKETDINVISVSYDQELIVVGDNHGKAKMLCYPAYLPMQAYNELEGHVSHLKSAVFLPDDSYLITAGEQDCAVMVWSYKASREQEHAINELKVKGQQKSIQDADLNEDLESIDYGNTQRKQNDSLLV